MSRSQKVLIVAKCNVNRAFAILVKFNPFVLIVAKCNVNHSSSYSSIKSHIGINSSKV